MMQREIAIRFLFTVILSCCLLTQSYAEEESQSEPGFSVLSAESQLVDDVVRMHAQFELQFSEELIEALQSGVALTLLIEIEVIKERDYIWSESIALLEQRYQITYQPLTSQWLLMNLNSSIEFQFPNLESLLAVMAVMRDFPLLDATLIEEEAVYTGDIRISVDRDSFPVPMRLMSYVKGDWHLSSEWFTWPLLP